MIGWIVVITIGIIFFVALIILVSLNKSQPTHSWKEFTRSRLKQIDSHTDMSNTRSMRACVIDLDTLLDHALKSSGFGGETMGERLKSAKNSFDRRLYNELWSAHKMRNQLVHESAFEPRIGELQQSRQALKESTLHLLSR